MAWYVIGASEKELQVTLHALGVPFSMQKITSPYQLEGITFPAQPKIIEKVFQALGDNPKTAQFKEIQTDVPGFIFAYPNGPHTVDTTVPEFNLTLHRLAQRNRIPISYRRGEEIHISSGVRITEHVFPKNAPTKELGMFGRLVAIKIAPSSEANRIHLKDENSGVVYAEIGPSEIKLLVNVSALSEDSKIKNSFLALMLEQTIPLALDPLTPSLIEKMVKKERERKKNLAQKQKETAGKKSKNETRQLWIERCRALRENKAGALENDVKAAENELNEAVLGLIETGWRRENLQIRSKAIDEQIKTAEVKARNNYIALSRHPAVDYILVEPQGDKLTIVTKSLPLGEDKGSAIEIIIEHDLPNIFSYSEDGLSSFTDPNLLLSLIEYAVKNDLVSIVDLAVNSVEEQVK